VTTQVEQVRVALPGRAGDPDFHFNTWQGGDGPAVVFCHGFPDLAHGWHHQLGAVAAAGFRVIAPDMRGYGGSSCPQPVSAYTLGELTGDLVALLDALAIDSAVFVGHDWGGFVTWGMPVLHPTRVRGVAAACTPYMPFPDVATHLAVVEGEVERQYVAWFQQEGVAEAFMDQHVREIMGKIMRTAPPLEEVIAAVIVDGKLNMNPFYNLEAVPDLGAPLLSDEDFAYYVEAFSRTGFRGGINWYRNIDHNAQVYPEVGVRPVDIPCLMLTADRDPALRPEMAADMPERCSNLEMHLIERAGHWVQQEQPAAFNRHLLGWLQTHFT
jgi:pimeloyl-ACP methyl ester carboxylesterase